MHLHSSFFELIQISLGLRSRLSHTPSVEEWKALLRLAQQQSVAGICFQGVYKIMEYQQAPDLVFGEWMVQTELIRQYNRDADRQCAEILQMLAARGLSGCILKGQSIGKYYGELCGLRSVGDIDVLVAAPMHEVLQFARQTAVVPLDWTYKHVHYECFADRRVDLHYRMVSSKNLLKNVALQRWNEHIKQVIAEQGITSLPKEDNIVFILWHIYGHVFAHGVGLRQLMDLYFLLRSEVLNTESKQRVVELVRSFGIVKFAKAVSWVMQRVFMLEDQYLLFAPDAKEGQFLLDEILATGNMGHFDVRYRDSKQGAMLTCFRNRLSYYMHLFMHYPVDVAWIPVGTIYWRAWMWVTRRQIKRGY